MHPNHAHSPDHADHQTLTLERSRQTDESDELHGLRDEIKWLKQVIFDAARVDEEYEIKLRAAAATTQTKIDFTPPPSIKGTKPFSPKEGRFEKPTQTIKYSQERNILRAGEKETETEQTNLDDSSTLELENPLTNFNRRKDQKNDQNKIRTENLVTAGDTADSSDESTSTGATVIRRPPPKANYVAAVLTPNWRKGEKMEKEGEEIKEPREMEGNENEEIERERRPKKRTKTGKPMKENLHCVKCECVKKMHEEMAMKIQHLSEMTENLLKIVTLRNISDEVANVGNDVRIVGNDVRNVGNDVRNVGNDVRNVGNDVGNVGDVRNVGC